MILYPDCDYFNEERDNQYTPPYGECEECYRYDICKNCERLGGGYYECGEGYDEDDSCKQGENLIIDWEIVCNEYNIEYEK